MPAILDDAPKTGTTLTPRVYRVRLYYENGELKAAGDAFPATLSGVEQGDVLLCLEVDRMRLVSGIATHGYVYEKRLTPDPRPELVYEITAGSAGRFSRQPYDRAEAGLLFLRMTIDATAMLQLSMMRLAADTEQSRGIQRV